MYKMFCSNCGKEINENSNFCKYCGVKLNEYNNKEEINIQQSIDNSNFLNKKEDTIPQTINKLENNNIEDNIDSNKQISAKNNKSIIIATRYFIGIIMLFTAVMFFLTKQDTILSILAYGIMGFTITPFYNNKLSGKKRLIIGLIALVIFGLFSSQNNNTNSNENKTADSNNKVQTTDKKNNNTQTTNQKTAPIAKGAVYLLPTQMGKGYDKTIQRYGVDGINKINELMPKVATIISRNPGCDEVVNVDVSNNRSTKNKIVMYGDCKNRARFYMSEQEINEKINTTGTVLSRKQIMENMKYDFENMCEEIIKTRLTYPSTYDKSIFRSATSVDEYKAQILIGFTAKNAFNLKLKYRAICVFNDKSELVDFVLEEEK